jgi:hypothetical protein
MNADQRHSIAGLSAQSDLLRENPRSMLFSGATALAQNNSARPELVEGRRLQNRTVLICSEPP